MHPATSYGSRQQGPGVSLSNVRHEFARENAGGILVLDGLTLDIAGGEFITLMGPSGSGKSTILDVIAGRLKPQDGQVRYGPASAAPKVSRVFQDPSLLPWRTVAENVRLPLELLNDREQVRERVARAMSLASVSEFADFRPNELSGGLASRVAIARALVTNPDLVLLDEPLGSLDEVTAETLMFQMASIFARLRTTVVLVTHSVDQAVFLSDRVLVLSPRPARVRATVRFERLQPRTPGFLSSECFVRGVMDLRRCLREAG